VHKFIKSMDQLLSSIVIILWTIYLLNNFKCLVLTIK
jgi:hypothetical protein